MDSLKNQEIDKRAQSQWRISQISAQNYRSYLSDKKDKFKLTLIDLFYIKNFKGGSATFNENIITINQKLIEYSEVLIEINSLFKNKNLSNLSDEEIEILYSKVSIFFSLCHLNSKFKINGLAISFASTLLHFYFPNLLPIIDRRILSGIGLNPKVDSQKQVIKIESYYKALLQKVQYLTKNGKTIIEIDQEMFIKKII